MNRKALEQVTTSLAVVLLFIVTFAIIIGIGDQIFNWNLFPPSVEKILGFLVASLGIIIIASVMVNIMLNISIIAYNSEQHHESNGKNNDHATHHKS